MSNSDPPSSFPGIWKFPLSRFPPARSPLEWISGKREDDNIGPLWRVYDKLYDLEPFIKSHPGGSEWLELTRGTDITEAFETSHQVRVELVEQTLAKFYLRDAQEKRMSPYTFKEDGFYKVLKRRVQPVFQEIGTGPTTRIKMTQDALAFTAIVMSIYAAATSSILMCILAGLFLDLTITGAHNFIHLRENWRKYYFDLGFLSSYEFRISHFLSHHLYPNTVMDYEVTMLEPMLMFFPKSPKNWIQRYAPPVYSIFSYISLFYISMMSRWIAILKGKQKIRWENLIAWAHLALLMSVATNWKVGLISWLLIHGSSSFFFVLCGVNAGHHDQDAFHEGDEARTDPDFGLCQLDALVQRSSMQWLEDRLITILTTFGEHSLHHLFPTVCHSKLEHVKPIFLETLKEFSEELSGKGQFDILLGTFKQLQSTEPKKLVSKKK